VRLKRLVIEDFLPPADHAALLAFALASEAGFLPSEVHDSGDGRYDPSSRRSLRFGGDLGAIGEAFGAAILARRDDLFAATGTPPFAVKRCEIELSAHGDGGFFALHQDTLTGAERLSRSADRLLTAVYWFHRQPQRFGGGEFALYPIGPGEPELIAPRDNRLVAFSAIAPHEVRPVSCPGGGFGDARFSINCWLHRARDQ
jgi:SM-20-related protein